MYASTEWIDKMNPKAKQFSGSEDDFYSVRTLKNCYCLVDLNQIVVGEGRVPNYVQLIFKTKKGRKKCD